MRMMMTRAIHDDDDGGSDYSDDHGLECRDGGDSYLLTAAAAAVWSNCHGSDTRTL